MELRLIADERPNGDDDVPQISGKINEMFVERVTGVKLREEKTQGRDEKPCLVPRLYRRELYGQPKQIIKTLLGQGNLANVTEENIITTLRNTGWEALLKRRVRSAGQLLRYETR